MLLLLLVACLPDDSFLLGNRALDYHLDRTRVLAVRATPIGAIAGEPRTIEALVMGPHAVERLDVSACGLRDDSLTYIWGMECFSNEELVTPLGDALPLVWETPDLSALPCGQDTADTGFEPYNECEIQIPVLVRAHTAEDIGYGGVYVHMWTREARSTGVERPEPPHALEVVGEARPGAEVELVWRIGPSRYDYFQWWIDAGTLRSTGRTGLYVDSPQGNETRNRLVIPDDFTGTLRVAVVGSTLYGRRSPIWDVVELEVRP
ncbi:MAG: hypothetical protein H6737_26320 [Alphaproteobacteria bacterium]|nr:hypothetical protein [Alphaproteobacteria bacterium]